MAKNGNTITKKPTMKISFVIKFVSTEEYADNLLNGKLFMHSARYYHLLEQERGAGQGDIREGWIFPEIMMYKNIDYPIYCLYAVSAEEIKESQIKIPQKVISDFHCENGYLVLIDFNQFEVALAHCDTHGYELCGGLVTYGIPSRELSAKLVLPENTDNLLIKHPAFQHQQEYRLIVYQKISNEKCPEITTEYNLAHDIRSFSSKIAIRDLNFDKNYYYIDI